MEMSECSLEGSTFLVFYTRILTNPASLPVHTGLLGKTDSVSTSPFPTHAGPHSYGLFKMYLFI